MHIWLHIFPVFLIELTLSVLERKILNYFFCHWKNVFSQNGLENDEKLKYNIDKKPTETWLIQEW